MMACVAARVLSSPARRLRLAPLALLAYVLLRGCDASAPPRAAAAAHLCRPLAVAHASRFGSLLGPISTFLALQRLSVTSQTLLFTLILPATDPLARGLLRESLPRRFGLTLVLLPAGLLISRSMQLALPAGAGAGLDPLGVAWALLGVAAFAAAGVLNRRVADKGWSTGLAIGLPSLLAALVLGERLGPHTLAGAGLILAALLVARNPSSGEGLTSG